MIDGEVRVAIVGVGNCASSLVQGVAHYAANPENDIGLMHRTVGPYDVSSIRFVAAFDVATAKVGTDLSQAIFAGSNCTDRFAEVPYQDVTVVQAPRLDGYGTRYAEKVEAVDAPEDMAAMVDHLVATQANVVVNYLPVGSEIAVRWWAEAARRAGCGFVNAIPVKIANDPVEAKKFKDAGLPVVGDDIKSQFGATIVHRVLAKLVEDRGLRLLRTYQLNVGGNMDFYNMLEQSRLASKKESKRTAVTRNMVNPPAENDVHIGPSDFVPWLGDHKLAFIRLECEAFGGVPLTLELRMDVVDSPNSAGVVIDAVRACKLAMDRGESGPVEGCSSWLFKSPPVNHADEDAQRIFEKWASEDQN